MQANSTEKDDSNVEDIEIEQQEITREVEEAIKTLKQEKQAYKTEQCIIVKEAWEKKRYRGNGKII